MVNATIVLIAATLRVFGSGGGESQLMPTQSHVADVSAFGNLSSERWKLHVKLRADATTGLDAGEAYAQLHVAKWLDVTAGRVIEKWGTGYGWNPTSFVGPAKDPTDPNDRRSAYRGVDMIRADVFVRDTNVSLYALENGQYAARVYRLIRGTDVSIVWRSSGAAAASAADFSRDSGARSGRRSTAGIALARVFGNALELHAEATQHRALAGGQYTFTNDINVVFELYRDQKTYALARIYRPFVNAKIDAELIALTSIRDRSTILRASITRKLRPNISAYLIDTEFVGREKPVARLTSVGLRYYF
ncbi:MAG: hypothetical protein DMF56_14365 [Acidobacteria bacterium]|nr:MAG: hypothetical protein DMF56_14365 [Acidobacteriota bacterium]